MRPPRRRCNSDRSGSSAAAAARSTFGRRGWAAAAPRPQGWVGRRRCRGRSSPRTTAVAGRQQSKPAQRGIQVLAQFVTCRGGRRRQGSHHQRGALGQPAETVPNQVPQSPSHPVPDHGVADGLAHDETHPGRLVSAPGGRRRACLGSAGRGSRPGLDLGAVHQRVHHQSGAPGSASPTDHQAEVLAAGEPGGRREHGTRVVRRTVARGPCGAGRPGSRGPRGCACAAGTRGSWRDGGCWAGRCACPCSRRYSRC
jgi:hypothetical protein